MSKASPTPWAVYTYKEKDSETYDIQSLNDGKFYNFVARAIGENQKENAKLIVTAVNAYNTLKATNKEQADRIKELERFIENSSDVKFKNVFEHKCDPTIIVIHPDFPPHIWDGKEMKLMEGK